MDNQLIDGKQECEFCIEQLTSDNIGPLISNSEELLDKMLKYQEQILTAIAILQPFSESIRQTE